MNELYSIKLIKIEGEPLSTNFVVLTLGFFTSLLEAKNFIKAYIKSGIPFRYEGSMKLNIYKSSSLTSATTTFVEEVKL